MLMHTVAHGYTRPLQSRRAPAGAAALACAPGPERLGSGEPPAHRDACAAIADDRSASGRGAALRQLLQQAIDRLCPDPGAPAPYDRRWRSYLILHEQYIARREPQLVAEQLGIARRTYFEEQAAALGRLAETLWCAAEEALGEARAAPDWQQLPPPPPDHPIIGRAALLDSMAATLTSPAASGAIVALYGIPGVGKTTLAIALAHHERVKAHFQNGVLWASVGPQHDAGLLLGAWLSALGVARSEIGRVHDLQRRAQLLHALLAGRRALLVLDDVWDAALVSLLRVGGPHCVTLVTTRSPAIAGELAAEGGVRVEALDPAACVALLQACAPAAASSDPQALAALADTTGGLPLALMMLGRQLRRVSAAGSPRRLGALIEQLRDATTRLRLTLPASPLMPQAHLPALAPISLEAVLQASLDALPEGAQHALHALALLPAKPAHFGERTAAALIGPNGLAMVDRLFDAGLLEQAGPGRYSLHPVIADFARLASDAAAARRLAALVAQAVSDMPAAIALPDDIALVQRAAALAAEHQMADCITTIALQSAAFMEPHGLFAIADELVAAALRVVGEQAGEHAARLMLLAARGRLAFKSGRLDQAVAYAQEGLGSQVDVAQPQARGRLLAVLGAVALTRGQLGQAAAHSAEALSLAEAGGDWEQGVALRMQLGVILDQQGDAPAAVAQYQAALSLAQAHARPELACGVLANLGLLWLRRAEYAAAEAQLVEGLALTRSLGHAELETTFATHLGALHYQQGRDQAAAASYEQALGLARRHQFYTPLGYILLNLAELAIADGSWDLADSLLDEAEHVAQRISHARVAAIGLRLRGVCAARRGANPRAAQLFAQALERAQSSRSDQLCAQLYIARGECALDQENIAAAEADFAAAGVLAHKLVHAELTALAQYGQARVAALRGATSLAIQLGQQSADALAPMQHRQLREVQFWAASISNRCEN